MIALRPAVDDYLNVRRSLGFKLQAHSRLLPDFVGYLETAGAGTVTTQLALAWATQPTGAAPVWWAQRLSVVRGFARHLHAFDPRTEVPPTDLLARRAYRPSPYLYSDADIAKLMATAGALQTPLRVATLQTVVGLIATAGMRPGEAFRLDRDDIDWDDGLMTIRDSKFHKSREIPLHPSTLDALAAYARLRDQCCPRPSSLSFFVSKAGARLVHVNVDRTFAAMIRRAGLEGSHRRAPRLHDLRHSMAVKTVVSWYRAGLDVDAQLPLLSTFLGHVDPANTFWYLLLAASLFVH